MRTDPIVIVICDGNNCFGADVTKNQLVVDCGWLRGGIEDHVRRKLEVAGWLADWKPGEKEKEFCPDCHVGAIKL